jgi:DNA (cytosine-5)-methyltransferase 1
MEQRTVIDLFAGVGGLSEGFYQAGCDVLAAVEWDEQMATYYELNHRRRSRRPVVLHRDVRSLDPQELLRTCGLEPEQLTFLIGGSPCAGFSMIGKRRKDDERNELILQFPRYLRVLKSRAFLIENVPGLIEFNPDILDQLLEELVDAGYQNADYQLVDAAACGVPQRRLRVIFYGTRDGEPPNFSKYSEPTSTGPTVWEAIADLPDPDDAAKRHERGRPIPYGKIPPFDLAKELRGRAARVTRWEPVRHTKEIVRAYRNLEQGKTDPTTKCWRLVADGHARTLRAGSRSRTACRPVHPFQPRVITVREAARLHSFPDFFPFPVGTSSAHVAIGNSVPPRMARAMAKSFCRALNGDA